MALTQDQTTAAATSPDASQVQPQQVQQPQQSQPVQQPAQVQPQPSQSAPAPSTVTVTNGDPNTVHPSVQKASLVRTIAETLAGGPRYSVSVDPSTGATTRQALPLSKTDIGLAIALEAVSGGLAGLSQTGPGATGKAGAVGLSTGLQIAQQRRADQQQQEQQAQADAQSQSNAILRAAQLHEVNSRTLLNTSEAEAQGADAIDKLVTINRNSGVLDVDPSSLESETPMTQAELMDAMQSGKANVTSHLGPIAGREEITNPDGSKFWQATHLIIKDPNTPVNLTQDMWDSYAAAQVPGFPAGTKISPNGVQVKLSTVQRANEIAGAHTLANGRLDDLRTLLNGTQYASQLPASIDFSKPGVESALERFQKYVSHNADNLGDPFAALQQMGADRRNPTTGQMELNPDAKYVPAIADALGGWQVLEAAHNQQAVNKADQEKYSVIDSTDKAEAVLSAPPKRFTPAQVTSAQRFVSLSQSQGIGKAVAEARAHARATGADVEAMFRFGTNPITGEKLTVANAPDSMLVTPSGVVVPQNLVTLYKPTAQERQTADTARQVLAISQGLQAQVTKNPALIGPLAGRDKEGLSKLGIGSGEAQKMLDDVSLLQSAVTKMHTGRFSNEILKKSGALIFPGMRPDEFNGAISSIQDVANRYAQEDQLRTVADYRQQNQPAQQNRPTTQPQVQQVQIPAGAQIGRDAKGAIVGYKLPNGQYVPLNGGK